MFYVANCNKLPGRVINFNRHQVLWGIDVTIFNRSWNRLMFGAFFGPFFAPWSSSSYYLKRPKDIPFSPTGYPKKFIFFVKMETTLGYPFQLKPAISTPPQRLSQTYHRTNIDVENPWFLIGKYLQIDVCLFPDLSWFAHVRPTALGYFIAKTHWFSRRPHPGTRHRRRRQRAVTNGLAGVHRDHYLRRSRRLSGNDLLSNQSNNIYIYTQVYIYILSLIYIYEYICVYNNFVHLPQLILDN